MWLAAAAAFGRRDFAARILLEQDALVTAVECLPSQGDRCGGKADRKKIPKSGALGAPGCCVPGVPPSISGTVKALRISGGLLTPPTCLESMRRTSPKGAGLCVLEALRWL